jgi:tetratricopeptide (TPR) repeat protein
MAIRIRLDSSVAKITVLLFVAGLLIPYSIVALSRYRAARLAEKNDRASLELALLMQPGDAEYHQRLGQYSLYVDQDAIKAAQQFQVAALLNPYSARNWLGLAQSEMILGNDRAAVSAVNQALIADPRTPSVAWESGNLLVTVGQVDQALQEFRFVLANDPAMLIQGLQLISRLETSPAKAARIALPPDPSVQFAYINLLAQSGQMKEAKEVWSVLMDMHQPFDPKQSFFFLNLLIRSGEFGAARQYWDELARVNPEIARLQSSGNLIQNASFEYPILNGGFDWLYLPSQEVDLKNEISDAHDGSRSLLITFHGQRTSDVGMHQYVVLEPNSRYHFSGYMRSNLQAANGVRFMLIDLKTQKHYLDTADTLEDRQWKEYAADFTTAAEPGLAILMIGRVNDTLVRGNLLVDDLHLEKVKQ